MCTLLGGRASEMIFFNEMTSGAQDDFEKVTKSAYAQITQFGMNERIGFVSFGTPDGDHDKPFSEATAQIIDEEARTLINNAMNATLDLLKQHKDDVIKVAERLLQQETLSREDMEELLGPRPFEEKRTYEQLVEGTELPDGVRGVPLAGVKDWNQVETPKTNPRNKSNIPKKLTTQQRTSQRNKINQV